MSPSLKAAEKFKLRGDLTLLLHYEKTGRQVRHHIRNTITYDGLNSSLYLWAQDGIVVTDYRIVTLTPGTNATPPTRGDLSVISPVAGASVSLTAANRTVSPATGELIITATLPLISPANGSTLSEVGLELGNGQLFARQIHPAFLKTVAFTLTYTWRLAVTA